MVNLVVMVIMMARKKAIQDILATILQPMTLTAQKAITIKASV